MESYFILLEAGVPEGSFVLHASFIALAIALAISFVAAVRWSARRAGLADQEIGRQTLVAGGASLLWLAMTAGTASMGLLHFSSPPTMLPVFPVAFAVALGVAFSPAGRRLAVTLPLEVLVGFQAFRVVVEILLHRAYMEGLMPIQMSYAGRNFDVLSGFAAIVVSLWLARGNTSTRLVFAWNTLGTALLLNIIVVALLSAPTPLRVS